MRGEVAAQQAEKSEQSNLWGDPLVEALGQHMIGCPACRSAGRATCPEGRSLSDVAAASYGARRVA